MRPGFGNPKATCTSPACMALRAQRTPSAFFSCLVAPLLPPPRARAAPGHLANRARPRKFPFPLRVFIHRRTRPSPNTARIPDGRLPFALAIRRYTTTPAHTRNSYRPSPILFVPIALLVSRDHARNSALIVPAVLSDSSLASHSHPQVHLYRARADPISGPTSRMRSGPHCSMPYVACPIKALIPKAASFSFALRVHFPLPLLRAFSF